MNRFSIFLPLLLFTLIACGSSKKNSSSLTDTDGDGLTDTIDQCINEKGPAENSGCPWPGLSADDQEILDIAENLIEFESGKSKLRASSYEALDQVAAVMNRNPKLKFLVESHTDSPGSSSSNQRLTDKRADAVKDYLVNQGVDKNQIEAIGYGEDKPIASNDTPEGRKKNRRTEISVINR